MRSPFEILAMEAMMRGQCIMYYFVYSAAFITGTNTVLAANGTTTVPIQINADGDFVVQRIQITALTAAGTFLAVPDYTINLIQEGSGVQLYNQAQLVANVSGSYNSNQFPSDMPMPILIQSNSVLSVTLVNRTATAANRADVALVGFKVKYLGSSNRYNVFYPQAQSVPQGC